jgi:putative phosphotransacetylase
LIPLGVSNRHVHLPGDKADELGVGNGDFCKIRIGGLKGTVFENVLVRVNDT